MRSTANYRPSNDHWLGRLISGTPHTVIGGPEDPYLLRWYVIPRNRFLNVYVHKFLRDDIDSALHDHPWWFVSLILRGKYDEITESGRKRRRAGSVAYRPATWRHRVALMWKSCSSCGGSGIGYGQVPDGRWMETDCGTCDGSGDGGSVPCWTLIITGRVVRTWGFWCRAKACPCCGSVDPALRGGPSLGYGCFNAWHDIAASTIDRELAARLRNDEGAESDLPPHQNFVPWKEFGDAGCGES